MFRVPSGPNINQHSTPSLSLLVLKRKLSSVSTHFMGNYISAMLKSLFFPKLTRERNGGGKDVLPRKPSSSDHHIVQNIHSNTSPYIHTCPLLTVSALVGNVENTNQTVEVNQEFVSPPGAQQNCTFPSLSPCSSSQLALHEHICWFLYHI